MGKEVFPRLRKGKFVYVDTFKVPDYLTGRLDLIVQQKYAEPRSYKIFAMANGIVDAFGTRTGIRPAAEALENELVLRGVKPREVKSMAGQIEEFRVNGSMDWMSYGNTSDGTITDVTPGRTMFVPSPSTSVAWFERYNTLQEEENEEDE